MTAATCSGAVDLLQMACGILATVSSTNTVQSKFEFTHFMQCIHISARCMYVHRYWIDSDCGSETLYNLCALTSSPVSKDICSPRGISIHLFRVSSTKCTLHAALTHMIVCSFVHSFLPSFVPSFLLFIPLFLRSLHAALTHMIVHGEAVFTCHKPQL